MSNKDKLIRVVLKQKGYDASIGYLYNTVYENWTYARVTRRIRTVTTRSSTDICIGCFSRHKVRQSRCRHFPKATSRMRLK